jgi:nucleotide-binding universal stress UspA family protein
MGGQVLVGIDGSEGSRRALRWAAREAAARGAVLQPVMAWQDRYDFGELPLVPVDEEKVAIGAKERMDTMLAEVTGGDTALRTDPLVLRGDPAQELCDRSAGAALLVVGSRGHGGFGGLLLGSVSTKCAHHSRCPVVIVPHHGRAGDDGPVRRIVAGVDGSEGSRRALRWAVGEAVLRGAAVDAVAVWHDPYGSDMSMEYQTPYFRQDRRAILGHVEERLARTIAEAAGGHPAVAVNPLVFDGEPAQVLCSRSADADLLVVGSRGHGGFARLLLGSVSTACAHHSRCPVAIVPGRGASPGDEVPASLRSGGQVRTSAPCAGGRTAPGRWSTRT